MSTSTPDATASATLPRDTDIPQNRLPVYAGLGPRFAALAIDLAIFCAFFFPVTRMVKGVWIMSATDHRWHNGMMISDPLCIIFFIVMAVYFLLFEGLAGATPGKMVAGIRVIPRGEAGAPGIRRSLVRNLLRFVDGLPALNLLGIWLILSDPEHARFGDRVAGTRVVRIVRHGRGNVHSS